MRSRANQRPSRSLLRLVAAAVMLRAVIAAGQPMPQMPSTPNEAVPSRETIDRAVQRLRADPDFSPEREVQTLRWKQPSAPRNEALPDWLMWLRGFGQWVNQSARYLVWVGAGLGAAWLATWLVRALGGQTRLAADVEDSVPTHVGDLDIRPETLPSDIGAAARALWELGQHRAALALLYRGLLSRLAHVHRLPIRDSTTEGDCLSLAAGRLPQSTHAYAERLVQVWQRSVYGRQPAAASLVHRLCDEFAVALDRRDEGEAGSPRVVR